MASDLNRTALLLESSYIPRPISVTTPLGTAAALIASDALSVVLSLLLASAVRNHFILSTSAPIWATLLPTLLLVLGSFLAAGLYPGVAINPVEEFRRVTLSISLAFLILLAGTLFLHDLSLSRLIYILGYVLAIILVPLARTITRRACCQKSWWGSHVAILGFGDTGKLILRKLQENPRLGLKPLAVLDDDPTKLESLTSNPTSNLITGPLAHCPEITASHKLSYGIVCMPALSRNDLLNLLDRYGQCFGHLLVIPNLIGMTSLGISARNVGGVVGLEVRQELLRPTSRFLKRALDLSIVLCLAPIILPLVAIAALLIWLEDFGPIFYKNERVGLGGHKFKAWKLRSMVQNGDQALADYLAKHPAEKAQWDATQKLQRDPRITRIGRLLRKTSIDELPQFWNVLIGEMSVVGPRPMLESQVDMYGPTYALYKKVRPGITGLWQVSGRNHLPFSERVNLDKYVIQNWSVWLDLYILALTARVVITMEGAY